MADVLHILGAGGHGKVVADTALDAGWTEIHFYDDAIEPGGRVAGQLISGSFSAALTMIPKGADAFVAIGANALRLEWLERLENAGAHLATVIAPSATISRRTMIEPGVIIVAHAVVAVDARVGRGAILNTACSIDHECVIGQGAHLSPGARLGGAAHVGARTWIGIGASVRGGIKIGCDCIVGAGAAVVEDIADGLTVVGVPAKPLGAPSRSSTAPPAPPTER